MSRMAVHQARVQMFRLFGTQQGETDDRIALHEDFVSIWTQIGDLRIDPHLGIGAKSPGLVSGVFFGAPLKFKLDESAIERERLERTARGHVFIMRLHVAAQIRRQVVSHELFPIHPILRRKVLHRV